MKKEKRELIGKVFGKEVYVTESFKEDLKKLNLSPEKEKELISKTIDAIAKRKMTENEPGHKH